MESPHKPQEAPPKVKHGNFMHDDVANHIVDSPIVKQPEYGERSEEEEDIDDIA